MHRNENFGRKSTVTYQFLFVFSFSVIFLLQWLIFYWACFQFKISQEGKFQSYPSVVEDNFARNFSHSFRTSSSFNRPNDSDLIIGKIFSCCRTWVMPILVKGNDVRSGTKVNAPHGWLQPAQASMVQCTIGKRMICSILSESGARSPSVSSHKQIFQGKPTIFLYIPVSLWKSCWLGNQVAPTSYNLPAVFPAYPK